jgi:hypothetical protein
MRGFAVAEQPAVGAANARGVDLQCHVAVLDHGETAGDNHGAPHHGRQVAMEVGGDEPADCRDRGERFGWRLCGCTAKGVQRRRSGQRGELPVASSRRW